MLWHTSLLFLITATPPLRLCSSPLPVSLAVIFFKTLFPILFLLLFLFSFPIPLHLISASFVVLLYSPLFSSWHPYGFIFREKELGNEISRTRGRRGKRGENKVFTMQKAGGEEEQEDDEGNFYKANRRNSVTGQNSCVACAVFTCAWETPPV